MSGEISWRSVEQILLEVYSKEDATFIVEELQKLPSVAEAASKRRELTESDACLICYADSILSEESGVAPLQALSRFIEREGLGSVLPIIHLLPFFLTLSKG